MIQCGEVQSSNRPYLGKTMTNQICIHEKIKNRLHAGKA